MLLQWFYQRNFFLVAVLLFLSFFFLSVYLCFYLSFVVPLFLFYLYWFLAFLPVFLAPFSYCTFLELSSLPLFLSPFRSSVLSIFCYFNFFLFYFPSQSFCLTAKVTQVNPLNLWTDLRNNSVNSNAKIVLRLSQTLSLSLFVNMSSIYSSHFWEIFLSIKQYFSKSKLKSISFLLFLFTVF